MPYNIAVFYEKNEKVEENGTARGEESFLVWVSCEEKVFCGEEKNTKNRRKEDFFALRPS